MLTSRKVLVVLCSMYAAVALLPAALWDSEIIPQLAIDKAMWSCVAFLSGSLLAGLILPFGGRLRGDQLNPGEIRGFVALLWMTSVVALYVLIFGPTSPLIAGFVTNNPLELALLREDAVKLNANQLFVRLYSWGRDLLAPMLFVLAINFLKSGAGIRTKMIAFVSCFVAAYFALWSGQKATIVNYLVAAIVFTAVDARAVLLGFARVFPLALLLIILTFAVTQPALFLMGLDTSEVATTLGLSVWNRVIVSPLDIAGAYVHAVDDLGIVSALDVIPYLSFIWTPDIFSIENRIAIEFFHQGVDSGHSNAMAFAYAYVLAGIPGAFLGGVVSFVAIRASRSIVAVTRSKVIVRMFDALLCYLILDLFNSNFIQYSIKILALAILVLFAWSLHRHMRVALSVSHRGAAVGEFR
jgi:hypothetical protein